MEAPRGNLRAVALISGDSNVRGFIQFVQETSGTTHVTGKISGLSPGFHGFHIHSFGDTTNGCISTGPHFNPLNRVHGSPNEEERHAGYLGNILAGSDGVAEISILDKQIPLSGSILYSGGRSLYTLILMTLGKEDTSLASQVETQAPELDAV